MTYTKFDEIILVPEDNGKQNQINVKNILLVVMAINQYGLMITLVSLLCHTQVKMLFIVLLVNTVVM